MIFKKNDPIKAPEDGRFDFTASSLRIICGLIIIGLVGWGIYEASTLISAIRHVI